MGKKFLILIISLGLSTMALSQSNHGNGGTAGGNCPDVERASDKLMIILNKYYPKTRILSAPEHETVRLKNGKEVSIPKIFPPMSEDHIFRNKFETLDEVITHVHNLTFQIQLQELEELNEEKLRELCGDEKVDEVLKNHPWLKTEPMVYELLEDINDFAFSKAGNPCGATWSPKHLKHSIQFLKLWFKPEQMPKMSPAKKKRKEAEEYNKNQKYILNDKGSQG